jgi:DNA repair protein RadC
MRSRAYGLTREHFWRIDLDARNGVLGCELISIGTPDLSLVLPCEVFKGALINDACKIAVVHNHPSQNVKPSAEDLKTTQRLIAFGYELGIEIVDHVILADDDYFSFKAAGLIRFYYSNSSRASWHSPKK